MKSRKIFALLLAAVMILATVPALAASDFTDVAADAYYADAVDWAVEKAVTTGRGNGIFDPDATVTRSEAVTFLWRMAGKPEPTQTQTFTDVESDANNSWYKTAVQWAVEQGITNGTGNGQFSPSVTCARGMILTMLYRMQGSPLDAAMAATIPENSEDWSLEDMGNALVQSMVKALRSEDGLTDVKEGDYYELPIAWATLNSILNKSMIDEATRTVGPNNPCPRGEMVYFLYHASGDAPAPKPEGAIETGTIPETVLFDKNDVKITVKNIESYGLSDVRMALTVENGSQKTLRVDPEKCFANTYEVSTQASVPVEDEDGFTFYADAVALPGETKECLLMLNSVGDKGIAEICELEIKLALVEVAKDEDGDYYSYVDEYASGDAVSIRTSLYTEGASYDQEGTAVYDKNGLKVLVTKAENDEFGVPQISVYVYNGSGKKAAVKLTGLKLDGTSYESISTMEVPAGKRCVELPYIEYDFDNAPMAKEAELTFQLLDPETWEPIETLAPVKVTFKN